MNIQLFIRGYLADIGDMKEFARSFKQNRQFSDLENPANIVTDYSYDITLPGTDTNRRIFGWIEGGTDPYNFNPNAAYWYVVNINGYKVSEGNIQLTEINVSSGRVSFKCSFFSKVHKIVMELSQKPVRDLSVFKENDGWEHFLNADLMDRVWMGSDPIADTIRYVPCRAGKYPNFSSSKALTPIYDQSEPPQITGWGSLDLGADYDEYAMREYRVQYQRPAVYMKKIVNGLEEDFRISLDSSVMQSPYINNTWMMCPQMSQEDETESCFGTLGQNLDATVQAPSSHGYPYDVYSPGTNIHSMQQLTTLSSGDTIFSGTRFTPAQNPFTVTFEFCVKVTIDVPNVYQGSGNIGTLYTQNLNDISLTRRPSFMEIELNGGNHTLTPVEGAEFVFQHTNGFWRTIDPPDNNHFVYNNGEIGIDGWTDKTLTPVKFTYVLDNTMAGINFTGSFSFYEWPAILKAGNGSPDSVTYYTNGLHISIIPMESLTNQQLSVLQGAGFVGKSLSYEIKTQGGSPMYVNMDTVFGSTELSCKDFLTDITKMLGCIWDFDSSGNLNVVTRNKFFEGYRVLDWTDKMDRSNVSFKPLMFDKRKYTFGYKSGDSLLENNYKDKVGLDWGKQYVDTGYPFNDETEVLLETRFLNTVQAEGQRKCVTQTYNGSLKYIDQTPYELPMIEKKDHGAPNEGFRLLFNNATTELTKGEYVYITQDSPYMTVSEDVGGKCWMNLRHVNDASVTEIHDNTVIMTRIPDFSMKSKYYNTSWDFAKSELSFSGETDTSYDPEECLYPRFWRDYITSLYDAKVRVMTANFWLDTEDLLTFSFKDFVVIDNHLWHVNRLIDFDYSGESLTKAELVEVTDISAWTNGQDWSFRTVINKSPDDDEGGSGRYVPEE